MKILRYVGDLAASIFAKDAQNETRAIFGDENFMILNSRFYFESEIFTILITQIC